MLVFLFPGQKPSKKGVFYQTRVGKPSTSLVELLKNHFQELLSLETKSLPLPVSGSWEKPFFYPTSDALHATVWRKTEPLSPKQQAGAALATPTLWLVPNRVKQHSSHSLNEVLGKSGSAPLLPLGHTEQFRCAVSTCQVFFNYCY